MKTFRQIYQINKLQEKRSFIDKDGSQKLDWDLPEGPLLQWEDYQRVKAGGPEPKAGKSAVAKQTKVKSGQMASTDEKGMTVTNPPLSLKQKGIQKVVLGNQPGNKVPDVHGRAEAKAKGFPLYGRGGFMNNDDSVWVDQGESAGHPSYIDKNFYYGVTRGTQGNELRVKGARVGADTKIVDRAPEVVSTLVNNRCV